MPRLPFEISERAGGLLAAGVIAATGLFFAWRSSLMDFGTANLPGPGFFPFFLGAALVAFAAIVAFGLWHAPPDDARVEFGHRDVLIVIAALLMVPWLFEPLGAYLTLGLFGAVLLRLIGHTSVPVALAAAAIAMAGCWWFFQVLLGVQLPTGPL
jgi:hypothetical protein